MRIVLDDDEIPLEELLSAILGLEGVIKTPDESVQPDEPVEDEPTTKVEVVEPVEEPTEIEEPEVVEQVEEPPTVRARSPWTEEDQITVLRLHDDEGMDWDEIGETMGRTVVACRVRYNILTKAIREEAKPETVEVKPESKPKKTKAVPKKRVSRSPKKASKVIDYSVDSIDSLGAKEVKAMREYGIDTLDHFAAADDVTLFNLMLGRRTTQRLTAARRQCVALLRKRNAEELDAEQQQLQRLPKKEPVPFVVEKNEDEVYMREAWDAIQQMRQDRKGAGVFVGDYVVFLAKERILRRYSGIEGDESVFDKELKAATSEMIGCINTCFKTGSLTSKHMGHVADLVILNPRVEWPTLAEVLDKRVP